jgi:hypothetical protein
LLAALDDERAYPKDRSKLIMADISGPAVAADKLCFIIALAHDFDVKVAVTEEDTGSNPADDGQRAVLEDHEDDPAEEELRVFIDELDVDEQIDLVALVWLGRGDGEIADWVSLRSQAADAHNERTSDYLMGIPLLADYLETGMSAFGLSCES